ncbi:MAG TPA: hypothetical protein VMY59_01045 [Candidatus Thermoplasmatota archaeon]|nr:hypothetical protein [Candidatus Thermoplasmatota archaeon]
MFDEMREKKASEALLKAQQEMDKINAEKLAVEREKQKKKQQRTKLENHWKTNNMVYGVGQPMERRLVMWLRSVETNPKAFEPQTIEAFGLTEFFKFLNQNAKKPTSPPKFNDTDDLIE